MKTFIQDIILSNFGKGVHFVGGKYNFYEKLFYFFFFLGGGGRGGCGGLGV